MNRNIDEDILQFDFEWREGDRAKAKEIAKAYIERNFIRLNGDLGGKTIEELVKMVEGYRDAGRVTERIVADMWLMAKFEPQNVSGEINLGAAQVLEAAERVLRGE